MVDCCHALQEKKREEKTKSSGLATKRAKKALRKKQAKPPRKTGKSQQSSKMTSSKATPSRKTKTPARRAQQLETSVREGTVSGRQAGDLEGLFRTEHADSESVDQLVKEGNVFEAGAVAGVEEADDQDTREVPTHEVPEGDVPDVPMAVEKLAGKTKIVATKIADSPQGAPPFHRIAEIHFPNIEALQACAASDGGKQTIANAVAISSGGTPIFLIAEEETFVFQGE